jgi:5-methylcytosine-specific restriction endonuclease McrA
MSDTKRRAQIAIEAETFDPIEIFERDRWRCGVCRGRVNPKRAHPHPLSPSLDHVVPVAEGGQHTRANARLTHLRCNLSRGARGGGEQLALIG